MSTEFTKAAEEALDQMKLAKAQSDALAISFTTGLAPGIAEAVEEFRKFTKGGASDGLKQVGEAVGHFLELTVKGFLIVGVTLGHFFALLEQKAENLKRTLLEVGKAFNTGTLAAGPFGGVVNAIRALTTASDPKQQATLDSLGEKIAEIMKGADPAKLGQFKKAVDALNAGDDAGEARAASAKQRLAVVQKKINDDEIKQLGELAKIGEQTNERLIVAERKLADARAAKDAQTAEGRKAIETAEQDVFNARVKGAEEAAARELAIIDLRTNALLKAAQTEFQTSRELASVKKEIEKQAAEARLAVNVKLFQDLTKLREDELNKARAAASTIIALDKEIAKNKQEAQTFSNRLTLDGLEGDQKVGFANRLANEKLDELRTAALTGNLDKARELRQEITGMANEIARLGEGRAAERVFDEANSLFELAANARKLQAQAAGEVANKEADKLKEQLKTLKEEIAKQANEIVATIKPKVDQDALKTLVESIQKTLATEKFTVQVYPQMAGQTAPGLAAGVADGGPILGYSPHPRADNILLAGTAGEFMQPVRAVRHYGTDFMESIRTLQFPRFADGGSLGGGSMAGGADGPAKIVELRAGRASARGMFTREGLHGLNEVLRELALGEDG